MEERLKALFNNVSTLKYLSCMALHAISVFDKVLESGAEKKMYFKSNIKCFN